MSKRNVTLRVKDLKFADEYQRSILGSHVKKIKSGFKIHAIGTIEVSRRADGYYYVIDGQHRIKAMLDMGMGETIVSCLCHDGLTVEQEAEVFLLRNTARSMNSVDKFKASIVERDPVCTEINSLLIKHGVKVGKIKSTGTVCAPSTLIDIYHNYGTNVLSNTIYVLSKSWNKSGESFNSVLLSTVSGFIHKYGASIDLKRLVSQMQVKPPIEFIATFSSARKFSADPIDILRDRYDSNRKKGSRLGDNLSIN